LILITGGSGQIAIALCRVLNGSKFKAVAKSELDISCPDSVRRALEFYRPRFIVNTAAYTAVDSAEECEKEAFRVNAKGPEVLACACAENEIPLLHLSTDYVYCGAREEFSGCFTEEDAPQPFGVYSSSKLEGELVIRENLSNHFILRVSGIFSGHAKCFPQAILRGCLKRDRLTVVDDQVSGPTSAFAVARTIRRLIFSHFCDGYSPWGTYHFAQQPFVTWHEFAQTIVNSASEKDQRFGQTQIIPVSTEEYGQQAPRPRNSCLDSTKIRDTFHLPSYLFYWQSDLDLAIEQIISSSL